MPGVPTLLLLAASLAPQPPAPGPQDAAGLEGFERRVRPLLLERCGECHAGGQKKGGLDLSGPAGWLAGGDLGPALVPGDPEASLLIKAVRYGDPDLAMPPRGRLEPAEIALLEEWVAAGAPAPAEAPASAPPDAAQGPAVEPPHWAFEPIAAPEVPPLPAGFPGGPAWERSPIDRFLAAGLAQADLEPAPRAERRSLARRASQVLTGLYPSASELESFLADPADDQSAFEAFLERLLASPHYGEHQARQWLDLVRYADSNGLDENLAMAEAWRYRDFVVQAFNQRWGFDAFLRAQLAGDLLPPSGDEARDFAHWTATGFWLLGPKMLAEQDQEKLAMDIVDEQIDVFSKTFLGLTIACARCHDHKFDPISARDYYALAGILRSTDGMESLETVARWRERELISASQLAERERLEGQREALRERLEAWRVAHEAEQREGWHRGLGRLWLAGLALASEVSVLEAEAGQGNLGADQQRWGQPEVVIVHTVAGGTQRLEVRAVARRGGPFALLARCASGEARGLGLALDGAPMPGEFLAAATGGFDPEHQVWQRLGVFELAAGEHSFEFVREGPVPHLDKLLLIPLADAAEDPEAALQRLAGPAFSDLDPALLLRAVDWVQRSSNRALLGPLAELAALPPESFEATAAERLAAARGAELNGLTLGLFDGPPPADAADLAQSLALIANGLWRRAEQAQREDAEFDGFDDPAAEAWRRALEGPTGLFFFGPGEAPSGASAEVRAEGQALRAELADAEAIPLPRGERALCVREGQPVALPLHVRGSHLSLAGDPIPRGAPAIFEGCLPGPAIPEGASGRLELADWLLDPRHPLTARVLVNRLWQQAFGVGLVESASNFGRRGARPSHPELLDWLAGAHLQRLVDPGPAAAPAGERRLCPGRGAEPRRPGARPGESLVVPLSAPAALGGGAARRAARGRRPARAGARRQPALDAQPRLRDQRPVRQPGQLRGPPAGVVSADRAQRDVRVLRELRLRRPEPADRAQIPDHGAGPGPAPAQLAPGGARRGRGGGAGPGGRRRAARGALPGRAAARPIPRRAPAHRSVPGADPRGPARAHGAPRRGAGQRRPGPRRRPALRGGAPSRHRNASAAAPRQRPPGLQRIPVCRLSASRPRPIRCSSARRARAAAPCCGAPWAWQPWAASPPIRPSASRAPSSASRPAPTRWRRAARTSARAPSA
jgi:hypothetical protein